MPDHHHVRIFVDELPVGVEFHFIKVNTAFADDGQTDMRVGFGVAVAGKVLDGGDNAAILHPVHVKGGLAVHLVTVFTEGAAVNHGVTAVVIDVNARSEVEVDAHSFTLFGNLAPHLVNQRVVFFRQGSEGHLSREGHATVEAHGRPPFAVNGHEHRDFAYGLYPVGEQGLFPRCPFEETDTAGLNPRHLLNQFPIVLFVFRGTHTDDEQLGDFFLKGHSIQKVKFSVRPLHTGRNHQNEQGNKNGIISNESFHTT